MATPSSQYLFSSISDSGSSEEEEEEEHDLDPPPISSLNTDDPHLNRMPTSFHYHLDSSSRYSDPESADSSGYSDDSSQSDSHNSRASDYSRTPSSSESDTEPDTDTNSNQQYPSEEDEHNQSQHYPSSKMDITLSGSLHQDIPEFNQSIYHSNSINYSQSHLNSYSSSENPNIPSHPTFPLQYTSYQSQQENPSNYIPVNKSTQSVNFKTQTSSSGAPILILDSSSDDDDNSHSFSSSSKDVSDSSAGNSNLLQSETINSTHETDMHQNTPQIEAFKPSFSNPRFQVSVPENSGSKGKLSHSRKSNESHTSSSSDTEEEENSSFTTLASSVEIQQASKPTLLNYYFILEQQFNQLTARYFHQSNQFDKLKTSLYQLQTHSYEKIANLTNQRVFLIESQEEMKNRLEACQQELKNEKSQTTSLKQRGHELESKLLDFSSKSIPLSQYKHEIKTIREGNETTNKNYSKLSDIVGKQSKLIKTLSTKLNEKILVEKSLLDENTALRNDKMKYKTLISHIKQQFKTKALKYKATIANYEQIIQTSESLREKRPRTEKSNTITPSDLTASSSSTLEPKRNKPNSFLPLEYESEEHHHTVHTDSSNVIAKSKILHFKTNPLSEAIENFKDIKIQSLEERIKLLQESVCDSDTQTQLEEVLQLRKLNDKLTSKISDYKRRYIRIQKISGTQIEAFRRAVYYLLGYTVEMDLSNKKFVLQSKYTSDSEGNQEKIHFQMNSVNNDDFSLLSSTGSSNLMKTFYQITSRDPSIPNIGIEPPILLSYYTLSKCFPIKELDRNK